MKVPEPGLTDLQIEFFINHHDPAAMLDILAEMPVSEIRELPQITHRAFSAVKEHFQS